MAGSTRLRHFGQGYSYFGESGGSAGEDVIFYGDTSGKYLMWDASADTLTLMGTLAWTGDATVTGAVTVSGLSSLNGGIAVVTNKFTVSTAGATLIKSTLGVGTNATEFTVSAAGVVAIASTLGVTGDFTVGATKFVVTATTGSLATKGSIAITGTSSLTSGITVGTSSNTAGNGIPLSNAHFQGNGFFADDGGVALEAGSTENLMVRYVITQANTGGLATSASSLHASMWVRGSYTGTGGMSGVWGSFLVPTGVTITNSSGTADMAGGHFSADIPTGATLASGSRAAGVSVGGNFGGTITGGLISGFRVRAPSAGTWTYILHADAAAAAASKHGIFIGASAAAHGSGIPLSETNYQANGFFADDGGVALTGSTENVMVRYAINEVIASGPVSASALHASQWVYANYTGSGNLSGVWGHFLIPTGVTIDNSSGARAIVAAGHFSLNLVSGGTLAASSQAAGVSVSGDLGGTITGVASGVRVLSPSAGNWTYGLDTYGMGTPTADVRLTNGATLYNSAAGAVALALGTRTGTAASNGLGITLTDSTTFATGVGNAVSLLVTAGGNRTGGAAARFNGILDQVTVGGTGNVNGMYIRMPLSGSPNLATNLISGLVVDMKELGATDYFSNIFLHKFNTTKGTGVDAFIVCALQELGVAKSGIHFQGINMPDNFLTITPGGDRDMVVTGTPNAATKKYLKVDLGGVAYGIELNSVA
jgi:hypothetical protein